MKLDDGEARRRLAVHDHAVLCTLHPERGSDPVPVVYALDTDGYVGIPVDQVKPKASTRLRREANLEHDPRATLLIEQWDRSDWGRLWWVRAELEWVPNASAQRCDELAALLAGRYPQYRDRPFERVVVLRLRSVYGWAAQTD